MIKVDYGLEGRVALVCGSSAGIGRGCAEALSAAGAEVILNGRDENALAQAARELFRTSGRPVRSVTADATTEAGRARLLETCPSPDILVTNAAGPRPGDFREFDDQVWASAVQATMIAPIMLIRAVVDGMIRQQWGRIINITSSAVRAPLPLLCLSNGARSGLTGFVAGLAREIAGTGVTINNLLPGRIETRRLTNYIASVAASRNVPFDLAAQDMMAANPMRRFGTIEEVGAVCAFLASRQAAYMTGQNILVDGGEFPGV